MNVTDERLIRALDVEFDVIEERCEELAQLLDRLLAPYDVEVGTIDVELRVAA